MSTTKRNPSVQPNEHSGFARDLADYLASLLDREGMSGRELTRRAATGSADHWAKIIRFEKVMTTNDIKVIADVFEMSAYEFVANARRTGAAVTPINVGPHPEDYGQSDFPADLPAAAEEERKPGE